MKYWVSFSLLFLLIACSDVEVHTSKALSQERLSEQTVIAAAISNKAKFSLIANGKTVCLWNNNLPKKPVYCIEGKEAQNIELIGISNNNRFFYISNRMVTSLYSIEKQKMVEQWFSNENIINDIAISGDGTVLLFGYRSGEAEVKNIQTKSNSIVKHHRLDINTVALSEDGQIALTGSSDKFAVSWQTSNSGGINKSKQKSRVNHVTISKDGKIAMTLDAIKDRYFWQLDKFSNISELQTHIKFIEFNTSTFSSDNSLFLSGSPKQKLQLWRVTDGALIAQWESHRPKTGGRTSVLAVNFIDETSIAAINSDGVYEVFNFKLPVN